MKGLLTYVQERFQQQASSSPLMAVHEVLETHEAQTEKKSTKAEYEVLEPQKAQRAQAAEQSSYIHMEAKLGADPVPSSHDLGYALGWEDDDVVDEIVDSLIVDGSEWSISSTEANGSPEYVYRQRARRHRACLAH